MANRNNSSSFDFINYLQKYGTLTAIIVMAVFFTLINPKFISINNILNVSLQFSFIAILAIGILFPMITGAFDLTGTEMIFFISAMGAGYSRIGKSIGSNLFTFTEFTGYSGIWSISNGDR